MCALFMRLTLYVSEMNKLISQTYTVCATYAHSFVWHTAYVCGMKIVISQMYTSVRHICAHFYEAHCVHL